MIDANALGQKRRGRRPKPNKRVPLSLLVDPALRTVIASAAEENGRSITRQTELLLKRGLKCFIGYSSQDKAAQSEVTGLLGKIYGNLDNETIDFPSSISARAGAFLEINYPGRRKDERIARDLVISAGMAKMLRQGRAWTVARLDQAMELWPGFREFVFPPPPSDRLANRLEQLAAGFLRLADEVAKLRQSCGLKGLSATTPAMSQRRAGPSNAGSR